MTTPVDYAVAMANQTTCFLFFRLVPDFSFGTPRVGPNTTLAAAATTAPLGKRRPDVHSRLPCYDCLRLEKPDKPNKPDAQGRPDKANKANNNLCWQLSFPNVRTGRP